MTWRGFARDTDHLNGLSMRGRNRLSLEFRSDDGSKFWRQIRFSRLGFGGQWLIGLCGRYFRLRQKQAPAARSLAMGIVARITNYSVPRFRCKSLNIVTNTRLSRNWPFRASEKSPADLTQKKPKNLAPLFFERPGNFAPSSIKLLADLNNAAHSTRIVPRTGVCTEHRTRCYRLNLRPNRYYIYDRKTRHNGL